MIPKLFNDFKIPSRFTCGFHDLGGETYFFHGVQMESYAGRFGKGMTAGLVPGFSNCLRPCNDLLKAGVANLLKFNKKTICKNDSKYLHNSIFTIFADWALWVQHIIIERKVIGEVFGINLPCCDENFIIVKAPPRSKIQVDL